MAKRNRKTFSIGGFVLQVIGAISAVYGIALLLGSFGGGGGPAILYALPLLVGISIGTLGTRIAVHYRCSVCGTRVGKLSKACSNCGQEFEPSA